MGGRGGKGKSAGAGGGKPKEETLYSEHNGVRTYFMGEDAARAFQELSKNFVDWNKGADIKKEGDSHFTWVKRSQMWDYLKRRDINEFIVSIEKGNEKRALKQLADYGYNIIAKTAYNEQAKSVSSTVRYYVGKKEMLYLGLDFKIKKYHKRGWKG